MVRVVSSNLKLIDRATRYITKLTDLDYATANALLFEIIEYVEPRMKKISELSAGRRHGRDGGEMELWKCRS